VPAWCRLVPRACGSAAGPGRRPGPAPVVRPADSQECCRAATPAIRTPHDGREPTESGLLRRLAVAVEQGPLIVCVTDAAGRIEYVNPKFTVATGYPLPAVRGRTCRVLKSGSMDLLDYQRLWQTIASGSLWQGEFHNRRSDGTLYWERASIWPLRDGAGVITHFVKTAEDITERKREQQALRESEDNLRRVFEASADPILLLEAGTFVACNQATVDALGAAGKHEIVGKPPGALSPDLQPDGRVSAEKAMAMIALAEERGTHHFDWTHRRADGSRCCPSTSR